MTLSKYEVISKNDEEIYVVITLNDGSTFGQIIKGVKTVAGLDQTVQEMVNRLTAQSEKPDAALVVGMVRTATEMSLTSLGV